MSQFIRVSQCCFCDEMLVFDVSDCDVSGNELESREGVAIFEITSGKEGTSPLVTAAYCPKHRIMYRV